MSLIGQVTQNMIFLAFTDASVSITSSKLIVSVVSLSMPRTAKADSLSSPIVVRREDKINFNMLKDRSQLAMDMATVNKI